MSLNNYVAQYCKQLFIGSILLMAFNIDKKLILFNLVWMPIDYSQ